MCSGFTTFPLEKENLACKHTCICHCLHQDMANSVNLLWRLSLTIHREENTDFHLEPKPDMTFCPFYQMKQPPQQPPQPKSQIPKQTTHPGDCRSPQERKQSWTRFFILDTQKSVLFPVLRWNFPWKTKQKRMFLLGIITYLHCTSKTAV